MPKEVGRKISEAKKGRSNGKNGLYGKASGNAKLIYMIDEDGNILAEFYGACEVGRKMGYASPARVRDVCLGKRKTAYGHRWIYAEDY